MVLRICTVQFNLTSCSSSLCFNFVLVCYGNAMPQSIHVFMRPPWGYGGRLPNTLLQYVFLAAVANDIHKESCTALLLYCNYCCNYVCRMDECTKGGPTGTKREGCPTRTRKARKETKACLSIKSKERQDTIQQNQRSYSTALEIRSMWSTYVR